MNEEFDGPNQIFAERVREEFDRGSLGDRWRSIYDGEDCLGEWASFRMETIKGFVNTLGLPDGGVVVDVGTGTGLLAKELSKRGFQVVALDISIEMLRQCSKTLTVASRVPIPLLADVQNLPFAAQSVDLVIISGVMEYLIRPATAIKEAVRVLKPAGWAIISFCSHTTLNKFPRLVFLKGARGARVLLRRLTSRSRDGNQIDKPEITFPITYNHWRLMKTLEGSGLKIVRRTSHGFRIPFIGRTWPGTLSIPLLRTMGNDQICLLRKRPVSE